MSTATSEQVVTGRKKNAPVVLHQTESRDLWLADSRSEPGTQYLITHRFNADKWDCDCPARKRCAHIDALIDRLAADNPPPSTTDFDEADWIDPSASWAAPALPEYRTTSQAEKKEPETMTTSAWSNPNFAKEAERGSGYVPPELDDDIYVARITEVSEPFDQPKFDDPSTIETKFFVQFSLEGDDVPEDAELRRYLTLPPAYLNSGFLSDKSNLYAFMEALGYDMSGRFHVNPPEWVGKKVRLVVKNQVPKSGGESRPVIDGMMPLKKSSAPPKRAARDEDDD